MNRKSNTIIYKNKIKMKLKENILWLTQEQISNLFQTTINDITMHIASIFKEKELSENAICKKFLHTVVDRKNIILSFTILT